MSALLGYLLAVITLALQGVSGLKLTQLTGPKYPDRGSNAKLGCIFETGPTKLYSVKWYKDENEFFRYMPDNKPPSQVFPLEGVVLDESMSGIDHVMLSTLNFSSSGSYRCEVSTEAPNFETIFLNHNMTVLSYPQHNPRLEGMMETYSIHDVVAVNCTAAPSSPAPRLQWYINNLKADDYLVERSPLVRFSDDTYTTSASLKFSALRQHFLDSGLLTLRCDAEAAPLETVSTTSQARLAGALTNQKLAQQHFTNSVSSVESCWLSGIVVLLAIFST